MLQRFIPDIFTLVLVTMSSPTRKVIMGGDRDPYTSLKYAHTSLKDGGVGDEPRSAPAVTISRSAPPRECRIWWSRRPARGLLQALSERLRPEFYSRSVKQVVTHPHGELLTALLGGYVCCVGGWSDAKRNSDHRVHLGKRSESRRYGLSSVSRPTTHPP